MDCQYIDKSLSMTGQCKSGKALSRILTVKSLKFYCQFIVNALTIKACTVFISRAYYDSLPYLRREKSSFLVGQAGVAGHF